MRLSPEKQRLIAVALLLLWCTTLIVYRAYRASGSFDASGIKSMAGLLWNLFLATVPLLWSSAFRAFMERKRPILAGIFFFLWLLFLPNAPYILTDLVHLAPRPDVPLWYVLALLLSCAGAGTMLGYISLLEVHKVIEHRSGKVAGWTVAAGSLMLCGFGIYLGRFLRWNSWDAFTNPIRLAKSILGQFIDPGPHPHPLSVTLIFGMGLIVGYLTLRAVATE
ncbi:MAG TPA: DUF1361 domain-containing protein [Abditibacteriaceae bacterium]|jgi:uncharacterized membrane protein